MAKAFTHSIRMMGQRWTFCLKSKQALIASFLSRALWAYFCDSCRLENWLIGYMLLRTTIAVAPERIWKWAQIFVVPYTFLALLHLSRSTISRFGERFRDVQYSLVSSLFAVLLYSRIPRAQPFVKVLARAPSCPMQSVPLPDSTVYTGQPQKSKPLSRIITKSHLNPPLRLDFSSISTTKWAQ